jgi:hypothetical protein
MRFLGLIVCFSFLSLLINRLVFTNISQEPTITEFYFFPNSAPWEITAGPDRNLWFTEVIGNRIGRITPSGVMLLKG